MTITDQAQITNSMNPKSWNEMVRATRELEKSLVMEKKVEDNEQQSVIVQRRGVWAKKDIKKNEKISLKTVFFKTMSKEFYFII